MLGVSHSNQLILVVDDDRDSAEALQALLGILVPEVVVVLAFDGQEGAELARLGPPHAVILEIEMPTLDGWGAATRIRAEAAGTVPILIGVSGNSVRLSGALRNGLIDHAFEKPIDAFKLVELLTA